MNGGSEHASPGKVIADIRKTGHDGEPSYAPVRFEIIADAGGGKTTPLSRTIVGGPRK
jgi:hypothetical protein